MQSGDPMEQNFENLEMKKISSFCLVIMFTLRIKVIRMSNMAHFCYFLLMVTKNQSLGKIFKCIWNLALSENAMNCYTSFGIFFVASAVFLYFYPRHVKNGNFKPYY